MANMVKLLRAVYTGTEESLTVRDPIYPRKTEVSVGATWTFHGHLQDHPTTWRVEAIYTISHSESGRTVESYVANVKRLDDVVRLRCEETGQFRLLTFRHLSYSAAWRLAA